MKHAHGAHEPLLPGTTSIGILGGGQLGRMMASEARRMGYRIVVLDPSTRCPAGQFADEVVAGALDDDEAALEVAHQVDVITLDTEHVPYALLERLEAVTPVRPSSKVLRTIQDRQTQKTFLDSISMPQARWKPVEHVEALRAATIEFGGEAILKARRAGYDGKGQARLRSPDDASAALAKIRHVDAVVEEVVPFTREISVVLARSAAGGVRLYPIAENVHRNHILHTTRAPAPMTDDGRRKAQDLAVTIINALDHVGVMAVEMFELADGRLLVNEIAPRTHNSGHYTYGASATSQFEQHVRAVCGLPLGDTRMLSGAVMLNLLGDLWAKGQPAWHHVLARPEARLHLYGKDAPAPGRKMGHVLLLDDDTDRALVTAEELLSALSAG